MLKSNDIEPRHSRTVLRKKIYKNANKKKNRRIKERILSTYTENGKRKRDTHQPTTRSIYRQCLITDSRGTMIGHPAARCPWRWRPRTSQHFPINADRIMIERLPQAVENAATIYLIEMCYTALGEQSAIEVLILFWY